MPSWLLTRKKPRPVGRWKATGEARKPPRRVLLCAFRIAKELIEGQPISATYLRDSHGIAYASAKRMMHELREAYDDMLDETVERGRRNSAQRVLRWKR